MQKTSETERSERLRRHPDVPGWGADLDPRSRPGIPRETDPSPREGGRPPAQQEPRFDVLVGSAKKRLTPVFGSAPPPRGLSGAMKRVAYRIPEHRASHWLLLLLSDRVDAVEHAFWPFGRIGTLA